MEWPKHGLSYIDIKQSPFTGGGSIVVTDDGIRRVSWSQWFRFYGIPKADNVGKVIACLRGSKAKVKYETWVLSGGDLP